jgi:hypothetical protein
MKKKSLILFSLFLIIASCSKEENNCIGNNTTSIEKEFLLESFEEIIVFDNIALFIKDSTHQKIRVETTKNLLESIVLKVSANKLEIKNLNECGFFKNMPTTKVYITSPNIKKIRNSSSLPVKSIGVLNFASLELISEDYLSDYYNFGDFDLDVNTQQLKIIANGPSNTNIRGSANFLNIIFAGDNPRFNGENLAVLEANLFARSTNDILINVSNIVNGNLYSTGDVILYKEPAQINLVAHYTGSIIKNY